MYTIQLWIIAISLFAIAVYLTAGSIPRGRNERKFDDNNKTQSENEAQTQGNSTSGKPDYESSSKKITRK